MYKSKKIDPETSLMFLIINHILLDGLMHLKHIFCLFIHHLGVDPEQMKDSYFWPLTCWLLILGKNHFLILRFCPPMFRRLPSPVIIGSSVVFIAWNETKSPSDLSFLLHWYGHRSTVWSWLAVVNRTNKTMPLPTTTTIKGP